MDREANEFRPSLSAALLCFLFAVVFLALAGGGARFATGPLLGWASAFAALLGVGATLWGVELRFRRLCWGDGAVRLVSRMGDASIADGDIAFLTFGPVIGGQGEITHWDLALLDRKRRGVRARLSLPRPAAGLEAHLERISAGLAARMLETIEEGRTVYFGSSGRLNREAISDSRSSVPLARIEAVRELEFAFDLVDAGEDGLFRVPRLAENALPIVLVLEVLLQPEGA